MPFSFTRRGLFGLAAGAYAASRHTVRASTPQPAGTHVELGIVARLGPDTPVMRSCVSQLLENGIYFSIDPERGLPASVPEQLDGYKALLFDEPAYHAALAEPATRRRLEAWVGRGGFVFRIDDPLKPDGARAGINPNLLVDVVASDCTYHMVVLAGLTPFHPEMRRQLLQRPEADMLEGLKADLVSRMRGMGSHWGEFNLHYWKAAKALIDTGQHPEIRPALMASIREMVPHIPQPAHFDRTAGYFGLAWLKDQTGERLGLDTARANLDEVIARRPRLAGVLTGTGYLDDPLGAGFAIDDQASMYIDNTIVERNVISTDSLHMYSSAFASMSRITGDPKYLAEVLKLAAYVARYHIRPTGTVAQVTRQGKLAAAAWGRGQSHALYGVLYILEEMPPTHGEFKPLVSFIRRVGEALRKYQDPETGLWRNVVDNPTARRESSSSIGITYVYCRAIREGWVDRASFEPMVLKAWQGLKQLYWRGGMAANCRGSAYGHDDAYYLERPQGWAKMPHMILAATEVQRLVSGKGKKAKSG